MDIHLLENLGLKEKEAKIYIILLKEGPSLANSIAKNTEILRSSIYDYLDTLIEKGFVTYTIKSGKKYFQAVSPSKIMDNFNEKKEKEEEVLKIAVLELSKFEGLTSKKSSVEVFEGKEGIKTAFMNILKDNPKEISAIGSGASYRLLPAFFEYWHKERRKRKILIKLVYNDSPEMRKTAKEKAKGTFTEYRFLPRKHISLTGTLIYNNNVMLAIWSAETPLAVLIRSKDASRTYKDNFEVLWKNSSKK